MESGTPKGEMRERRGRVAALAILLILASGGVAAGQRAGPAGCVRVEIAGEAMAGQSWQAAIGEGWLVRLVPIAPSGKGYTGWDIVVEPGRGGGYPDGALLATPPYGSVSEREVGTTYGLRAQDAIAWTPRRFHFLRSVRDLARARELFAILMGEGRAPGQATQSGRDASIEMMELASGASPGEFRILDARLAPGTGDPPSYASQWAANLRRVPHTMEAPVGRPSARGELQWIRFSVSLWLANGWRVPAGLRGIPAKCAQ